MNRKTRWTIPTLPLLVLLAAPALAVPAAAARAVPSPAGTFWQALWSLTPWIPPPTLVRSLARQGYSIDPDGGAPPNSSASAPPSDENLDKSFGIDPNGGPQPSPVASLEPPAGADTDKGFSIDPDGRA